MKRFWRHIFMKAAAAGITILFFRFVEPSKIPQLWETAFCTMLVYEFLTISIREIFRNSEIQQRKRDERSIQNWKNERIA